MDLKEAYERIEWQIKHDVDNYDKNPTVAGIIDLERIKEAINELQSYKEKEDRLREELLIWGEVMNPKLQNKLLQILNEGEKK